MKYMNWCLFVFFCLQLARSDVSCDEGKTAMDDISIPDIPAPKISRDYPACKELMKPTCLVVCSVSNVTHAQLSWYKENISISSLTVSDLNSRLYLEVKDHDKSNYRCVVSRSGFNQTSHLNIGYSCQSCSERPMMLPVSEEDSVTLLTNLTEAQSEDHIMWLYGDSLIAEVYENITACYDCEDKRFSNKLQLDSQTGSLSITNISKINSGLYDLEITNGPHQTCQQFNVTVYEPLPIPVVSNNSTQCSAASDKSKCVVMCSVNKTDVTLSWYNGSRLNSSIIVSDLNISNFLCLEVEYKDNNTYTCVVNNCFTNKTTQLNMNELCKDQPQIIGVVVGVGVGLVILLVVGVSLWKKEFPCQKDARGDHHVITNTPAQGDAGANEDRQENSNTSAPDEGSSGQGASDNNSSENAHLLDQASSQESIPVNTVCF